jgi:hypothetical protein
MDRMLFNESQKFNQWWLWLILLSYVVMLLIVFFVIWQIKQNVVAQTIRITVLVIIGLLIIVPAGIFFSFRLDTQIKHDGVYVRFLPFYSTFKVYEWRGISKCYVRQYNPIEEYGGWGFRIGSSGKAFNVSGDKGLQLEFRDQTRMLIGTNKPIELTETLKKIGRLQP